MNFLTGAGKLLGVFQNLPMVIDVIQLAGKVIVDAESTDKSGEDKLTAVLNDVEAFLAKDYPEFEKPFTEYAHVIEEIVTDIVNVMNLFKRASPTPGT